jgi:hypothetical protein
MRVFPLTVVLALLLVGVCALDIVRSELNIHALANSDAQRTQRELLEDGRKVVACAAGKTSMIFYKGVYCNGR